MKKKKGYLLPASIDGYDLDCVTLKIPRNAEYRQAFVGHLHELTRWWTWEKDGTTRAAEAAKYWHKLLFSHLIISPDCEGDGMGSCCNDILAALNRTNSFLAAIQKQIAAKSGQDIRRIAEELFELWKGKTNPSEINVNVTNNYGANQSEPNLCYAVMQLTVMTIEEAIVLRQELGRNQFENYTLVLGIVSAVVTVFATPAAAALVAAFGAIGGAIATGALADYDVEQIRNANAIAIANALYCALKDTSTTYGSMQLPSIATNLTGIDAVIYERIAQRFNAPPSVDKLRFWQAWINILGESIATQKTFGTCMCITGGILWHWQPPNSASIASYKPSAFNPQAFGTFTIEATGLNGDSAVYAVNTSIFGAGRYIGGTAYNTVFVRYTVTLDQTRYVGKVIVNLDRNSTPTTASTFIVKADGVQKAQYSFTSGHWQRTFEVILNDLANVIEIYAEVRQTYAMLFFKRVTIQI